MATGVLTESDYEYYCAACTACQKDSGRECTECGSAPPSHGWPLLVGSDYSYLGQIVDGRYLLDQFLGDGSTGYVYRARAVNLQRKFACKIVDTRRYGKKQFEEELLRRFRMEVDAMAQLRNPHVVAIYEAMQLRDGVFALLMDFVDGRTLHDLLDRVGRIKMDRGLDLMRQVANGLYEAHRVGFIHRDLKPDNIMIERLPASGFFARILDFGIVHVMGSVESTQGFRGTPLYASPEQCMGDPGIDNRSDIYSLGCVFFHAFTGQPPFPGTESLAVMDAHVHDAPPSIRDVLPTTSIPAGLEELIGRMLAKKADDRPDDLNVVIGDIDRIIRTAERASRKRKTEPSGAGNRTISGRPVQEGPKRSLERSSVVEVDDSAQSQAVSPLMEYHLPDAVSAGVTGFTACALTEEADLATVADQNNHVHIFSLKADGDYHTLTGATATLVSVFCDSSGSVFAAQLDGAVLRWSLDDPGDPVRLGRVDDRIYALSAVHGEGRVLCGTEQGSIITIDVDSGTQEVLVDGRSPISALGLSTTEKKLIVGYWGGHLETIHLGTKATQQLESVPENARSIVVSTDGYLAAVLDEAGNVRILSMVDGEPFFTMHVSMASLRAIAFADDGHLLGLGVVKTALQLWEIRNRPVHHG